MKELQSTCWFIIDPLKLIHSPLITLTVELHPGSIRFGQVQNLLRTACFYSARVTVELLEHHRIEMLIPFC